MSVLAIAMKRAAWVDTLRSALREAEAAEGKLFTFAFDAIDHAGAGQKLEVRFDNDDMEREEVPVAACYVEVHQSGCDSHRKAPPERSDILSSI